MCCKRDDKLTKELRARTRPIRAWKVYLVGEGAEPCLWAHQQRGAGGSLSGPGYTACSDEDSPAQEQRPIQWQGIWAYLDREDAQREAKLESNIRDAAVVAVRVLVEPADVLAAGVRLVSGSYGLFEPSGGPIEIMAKQVLITPAAWRQAVSR